MCLYWQEWRVRNKTQNHLRWKLSVDSTTKWFFYLKYVFKNEQTQIHAYHYEHVQQLGGYVCILTLIIGHKHCSMLSILNEKAWQKTEAALFRNRGNALWDFFILNAPLRGDFRTYLAFAGSHSPSITKE